MSGWVAALLGHFLPFPAGCDGLPHDDDFEISRKVPAIMADCIKRLKKAHPNWTFHFYQVISGLWLQSRETNDK